jgi:hypothetical protein
MGGDDSQKLMPRRGIYSSPGRSKPPAHSKINTVTKNLRWGSRGPHFPVSGVVAQLQIAWGIFRKQTWYAEFGNMRSARLRHRRRSRTRVFSSAYSLGF